MMITKEELEKNVDKPVILISAKEGKGINHFIYNNSLPHTKLLENLIHQIIF